MDNILNGQGSLHLPDGSILRGPFVNNNPRGRMTKIYPDGRTIPAFAAERRDYLNGIVSEGTFVNDRLQGPVKVTFKEGHVLEGEFVDNRLNGQGCWWHADGTTYCGKFVNNALWEICHRYSSLWKGRKRSRG